MLRPEMRNLRSPVRKTKYFVMPGQHIAFLQPDAPCSRGTPARPHPHSLRAGSADRGKIRDSPWHQNSPGTSRVSRCKIVDAALPWKAAPPNSSSCVFCIPAEAFVASAVASSGCPSPRKLSDSALLCLASQGAPVPLSRCRCIRDKFCRRVNAYPVPDSQSTSGSRHRSSGWNRPRRPTARCRTGFSSVSGYTSRIPPRIANCPGPSACTVRS